MRAARGECTGERGGVHGKAHEALAQRCENAVESVHHVSMSKSATRNPRALAPVAALDALLEGPGGDPIRRALWLDALDRQLRPFLPPALAAHARLGNVHDRRLVYLVDAPAWHARLRLAGPGLLDAARSIGLEVSSFVVKTSRVAMPAPTAPPSPRQPDAVAARKAAAALDLCQADRSGPSRKPS